MILDWIAGKQGGKEGTGFIWLRMGTSGGLFWTWWWTLGFTEWREFLE